MSAQIMPLKCPQCGNTSNSLDRELGYGHEFTCKYCGTVSVLIMNRQLYMPSPHEKICAKCGRVAMREARVCQCGEPLVRKCIHPHCLQEFPVNHKLCDFCGWDQSVALDSPEGRRHNAQRAVRLMDSPDSRDQTLAETLLYGSATENVDIVIPAVMKWFLDSSKQHRVIVILQRMGSAAAPAIPQLESHIKGQNGEGINAIFALQAIGAPAVGALVNALRHNDPQLREQVLQALRDIGEPAADAVPAIVPLLKDSSSTIRFAAAEALGRMGAQGKRAMRDAVGMFSGVPSDVKDWIRRYL